MHDITDRRQTETRLRDSEEQFRATFEQAAIGIVHCSFDGHWLRCNRRFAEIVGYPIEEIPGMTFLEVTLPEDRTESEGVLKRLARGEADSATWEKRYLRKNGSVVWTKLTISTQRDGDGHALHFVAFVEDIQEQKESKRRLNAAAEALSASEARYRIAFQTSLDAITINRMDDGTYIDVNNTFFDIFGYQREEVLGRTTIELGIWADLEDRKKMIETLNRDSVCRNLEVPFRKKNGAFCWGMTSVSIIELDGTRCLLSVIRDISEAKETEERLAIAAKALQLSEERYRIAFQTSLDCILISTLKEGLYIDVNQAFLETFGFERDEVIGHTSIEIHAWADLSEREAMIEVLRKEGVCRNQEVHYRRKNGEIFWGLLSTSIIEVGGVPCHLGVIRDISEAKAVELRMAEAAEALRGSEALYRTAFQTTFDAYMIANLENGVYLDVNQAYLDITGFEREEVLGKNSQSLNVWVHQSDRDALFAELRANSICKNMEIQFRRKNGEIFWGRITSLIIEIDGQDCSFSTVRDISEAKASEQRMAAAAEAVRLSEERYRTAFQTSLDGISITALEDGRYIDVNQAFLRTFGYERGEVIGRSSLELEIWADPYDRQKMVDTLRRDSRCQDMEVRFQRKNKDIFWVLVSAALIDLEGISCILFVIRDISEAKAAAEEIEKLAFYDPLTHLPNRRLLLDRLGQALTASARNGRKRALLFVDLDNFKTVNDILGHQVGDLLLKEVARRMMACVRKADTVARLGGDEFVVMLEELDSTAESAASHARGVGEKILAALQQPYLLAGNECRSDSSIGITIFGDGDKSTDEILRQADIAMYQAKTAGRGNLRFFAPALQAAVNARAALEEDLRLAIAGGQFLLYYQPQADRGRLIGAEGLIRWNHPKRGILAPGEFIPLAEETGQILSLGSWVLETACEQIAAWGQQETSSHLAVAVNISARQFRQADFVEQVLTTIARSGANPRNLKLELTESILVENIEDVIAKMELLKENGVRIALDDFGTGYSSLSYLKRLPLEQLKIDRSFINDILFDVASGSIVETVISLGRAMGLVVMAEGVETAEQREFLAQLGCYTFQGYLLSKPLPLEQFHAMWPELFSPTSN